MTRYSEAELAGTCRELDVWSAAMELALAVYSETKSWPAHEQFGLTQQIRRSAASVPANIGEGSARRSPREFAQFLAISRGSLRETETFWLLARRLGYAEESEQLTALCIKVGQMLTKFQRKLEPRS